MSAELLDLFFPSVAVTMKEYALPLYEMLFPAHAQDLCPTPYGIYPNPLTGDMVRVAWPALVPFCILGVLCALGPVPTMLGKALRGKIGHFSWTMAFLFFAGMNSLSCIYHCFVPKDHSETVSSSLYLCDITCTGCSSLCIIIASCVDLGWLDDRRALTRGAILSACLTLVGLCVYAFFNQVPWVCDLAYLGVTKVAGAVLLLSFFYRPKGAGDCDGKGALIFLLIGGLIFISGIPLDRLFCEAGLGWGVNMIVLAFAGCDVAFVGLYAYIVESDEWRQRVRGGGGVTTAQKKKKL